MAVPVGAAPTPDASEAEVLETSRPAADRGTANNKRYKALSSSIYYELNLLYEPFGARQGT